MPTQLNILIVGSDPQLREEVAAALESVEEVTPVWHWSSEHRTGVETARSRAPDLVLVQMTPDIRALELFAREISVAAPAATLAAVFRDDAFGNDVSESAILIEALRAGVKDFLRRPVSTSELRSLLGRLDRERPISPGRTGRIVSVISNKGGVGKSTLAVNLACGLAQRHPQRVLLVDASLQMGVCASTLDLQPKATLSDAVAARDRLDESLLRQLTTAHECGLHLLAAPASALDAAEIDDEMMARVLTLARRTYDVVVVDTFPMLDRIVVAVLDMSDRAYVVCESVVPTLLGVAQFLEVLDSLRFPQVRQRIVLNRYASLPGGLKPDEVAERLGRHVDHVLPYDRRVLVAANAGRPTVLSRGRLFGFGRRLRTLIDEAEATMGDPASINGRHRPDGMETSRSATDPKTEPPTP